MSILDALSSVVGTDLKNIAQGPATLLSTMAAMVGWYVARRGTIKSERTEKTVEYINVLMDDKMKDKLVEVGSVIRNILSGKIQRKADEPDIKNCISSIKDVLANAERAATSVAMGYISERYDWEIAKTLHRDLYKAFSWYIFDLRREYRSNSIFENYEMFIIRNYICRYRIITRITETFYGYPLFKFERLMFKLEYGIGRLIFGASRNHLDETTDRLQYIHLMMTCLKGLGVFFAITIMAALGWFR